MGATGIDNCYNKEMKETFGTILTALRKKRGICSIRQAARMLNISHVHLYEMEKGIKFPSSELLYKISRLYDVSSVYLLILIEKDKGRSIDENKVAVVRFVMDMPEDEFRELQKRLKEFMHS